MTFPRGAVRRGFPACFFYLFLNLIFMNPSTVRHLFVAEALRLRWLILIALCLLVADASQAWSKAVWDFPGGMNLWSPDLPNENPLPQFRWGGLFGPAAALLAAMVGWQGTTVMDVRPVRLRELAAAKLLSLTLFLILPQALAILLVLMHQGISPGAAFGGMVAAAGAFVPRWIILAVYGRLAGSFWRFGAALVISWSALALYFVVHRSLGFSEDAARALDLMGQSNDGWGSYPAPAVWGLLWLLVVELLLLQFLIGRRWGAASRCAAAAVVILGTSVGFRYVDWKPALAETKAVAADGEVSALNPDILSRIQPVRPSDMEIENIWSPKKEPEGSLKVLQGEIGTSGLPDGWHCVWLPSGKSTLVEDSGRTGRKKAWSLRWQVLPEHVDIGIQQSPDREKEIAEALASRGIQTWKAPSSFIQPGQPSKQRLGEFRFDEGVPPPSQMPTEKQGSWEADLTGVLYRWEMLADLPLEKESRTALGEGWVFARNLPNPKGTQPLVDLAYRMPLPLVVDDPLLLSSWAGAMHGWQVFLFLPSSGELIPSSGNPGMGSGPLLAGAWDSRMIFSFQLPSPVNIRSLTESERAEARVIIMKPRIAACLERHLPAEPVVLSLLKQAAGRQSEFGLTIGPRIEPRHFFEYARPRRPDPSTATDAEVGKWMQLCLGMDVMDDWQAAEMSVWVPGHLELLLKICDLASRGQRVCCEAVSRVVPESRKAEIIAKLDDFPWLVGVIRRRGWIGDAREPLMRLFASGKLSGLGQSGCVAEFEDPATYGRLLADLERNGSAQFYENLHRLPGIEPALTATVKRYFERVTIHGRPPAGEADDNSRQLLDNLKMPLRHGLPEALDDALILIKWLGDSRLRSTQRLWLASVLQVPPEVGEDLIGGRGKVSAFFLSLKPEDLHWDAFTRRWSPAKR